MGLNLSAFPLIVSPLSYHPPSGHENIFPITFYVRVFLYLFKCGIYRTIESLDWL